MALSPVARRRAIVLAVLGALGLATAASQYACVLTIPSQTCKPFAVDAIVEQAEGTTQLACETCLEDRCCDPIGRCDDALGCEEDVKRTHACVIDASVTASEKRCVETELEAGAAHEAYQCMHDTCARECGLPACSVDPSFGQFLDVGCDRCVAAACCNELNACAGNRACKLVIDCITTRCRDSLGAIAEQTPLAAAVAQRDQVCTEGPDARRPSGVACIDTCIADFADYDQTALFDRSKSSECLAIGVFACLVGSRCGSQCEPGGGAGDAASDAPADVQSDVQSDAASDAPADAPADARSDAPTDAASD
jgi:hypothetical protein